MCDACVISHITRLVQLCFCCLQMDDEPFNPDYVEVDRVLDISESTDENGEVLLIQLSFCSGARVHALTKPSCCFVCRW